MTENARDEAPKRINDVKIARGVNISLGNYGFHPDRPLVFSFSLSCPC